MNKIYKEEKGITLLTLTITIIIMIILASIITYSGVSSIESSKLTKFRQELEILQAQVDVWHAKYFDDQGQKIKEIDIGEELTDKAKETLIGVSESENEQQEKYKLFTEQTLESLGIQGIERTYIINIEDRNIVSLEPFEANGQAYYTLADVTGGQIKTKNNKNIKQGEISFDLNLLTGKIIQVEKVKLSKNAGTGKIQYRIKNKGEVWQTAKEYIKSENNIKDGIKEGFESCRDSYNLIKPSYDSKTYNGLTLTFVDNGFNLTGTGIDMYGYFTISKITLSSGTYTINGVDGSSGSTYQLVIYDNTNKKTLSYVQKNSVSFTITDTINVELRFYPYQTTYDNKLFQYQLEKGTTVHDYEKYGEKVCKNRLDEANETSKGILGKIKDILSYINPFSENFFAYKLVELLLNGLKSLIVPDDFDFINDFKEVLENKLGFIASVPIQLLDYVISLKDKVFTPMTTISFPKISIFGYYFWDDMEIDITQGLNWVAPFKYLTDLGCVIIMVNTLKKWYTNFTGGDEK